MPNLKEEFEQLLDGEAQRIYGGIARMYKRGEGMDSSLVELVKGSLGEKFAFCQSEMVLRVVRLLLKPLHPTNDERLFMEQPEYSVVDQAAAEERRSDLASASEMLAVMLAKDYVESTLPCDLLEVFGIFAEDFSLEESIYFIENIAYWLRMKSGLCLVRLSPLVMRPCLD